MDESAAMRWLGHTVFASGHSPRGTVSAREVISLVDRALELLHRPEHRGRRAATVAGVDARERLREMRGHLAEQGNWDAPVLEAYRFAAVRAVREIHAVAPELLRRPDHEESSLG